MKITRRSFVKKSSYTAAAVTILGAGVGLAEGVSSGVVYEHRLKCVIDPSEIAGYAPNWSPIDNDNAPFGINASKTFDPDGPGGEATVKLNMKGFGPANGDVSLEMDVRVVARARFQHPAKDLAGDYIYRAEEVTKESSAKALISDKHSPVVTITPPDPVQKGDVDVDTEVAVKVTPSFVGVASAGYHDDGIGTLEVEVGVLKFKTDDVSEFYSTGAEELAWGIVLQRRVYLSGDAWSTVSTLEKPG